MQGLGKTSPALGQIRTYPSGLDHFKLAQILERTLIVAVYAIALIRKAPLISNHFTHKRTYPNHFIKLWL